MMTDKELLELAAKAAGIKYDVEKSVRKETAKVWWGLWLSYDREPHEFDRRYWNPLTDDGDAFRLQVKLHMDIYREYLDFDVNQRSVSATAKQLICEEEFCNNDDLCSATRRAIVRAAAEIGKNMKKIES
jgi:hypothetical protein